MSNADFWAKVRQQRDAQQPRLRAIACSGVCWRASSAPRTLAHQSVRRRSSCVFQTG